MNSLNKNVVFLCLLFLISVKVQSQSTVIDSLKNQLLIHKEKDTTRVNILNALAFSYHQKDVTITLEFIDESKSIAESIDFKKGAARSLFLRGLTEMAQSNFDKVIEHLSEAVLLYEKIGFKPGISECYAKMGLVSYYKRDYNKSIEYFKNSIRIDESIGEIENIALSLKYIGYAYSDSDNFDESLLHYNKALKINREYKNKREIASCLNNIGILYADRSNFPLVALEYYNESLAVSEEIKDSLGMLKALNNIGNIYTLTENHHKAIEKFKRSLAIQKNIGHDAYIAVSLNNLGNTYKKLRKLKQALTYLTDALQKSKEINNLYTASASLNNIGGVYRALEDYTLASQYYYEGIEMKIAIKDEYGLCGSYTGLAYTLIDQQEYNKALVYTLKANEIADKLGIIGLQRDVYDLYSRIYKNTGNHKKAYENLQQYMVLSDSLFNKKNIEKLASLEYEYKYKRALDSASIRELQLTRTVTTTSQDLEKSQRNLLLGVIAFLVVALVLGGIIFFLKLRNETSKTQNIATEQKLLRSQMTPHFIFNSLSVLQGMILNKEEKKSVNYLSKFSKLLRITLENSRDKTVLLSQELTAIENYLALQNLENEAFNYAIIVDNSIDIALFKIPPMLIQPFIENAIEHGFENKKENRKIDVHLTYSNEELNCTITDNGIGIDTQKENKTEHKKSLATTITSERLRTLSKDFKMKGSVTIENRQKFNEQGTIVTLVIPHKIDKAI